MTEYDEAPEVPLPLPPPPVDVKLLRADEVQAAAEVTRPSVATFTKRINVFLSFSLGIALGSANVFRFGHQDQCWQRQVELSARSIIP